MVMMFYIQFAEGASDGGANVMCSTPSTGCTLSCAEVVLIPMGGYAVWQLL